MLSQTVEYALRAATYLASDHEALRTVEQVATATQVPGAYLSKVMQQLSRAGIVVGRRGVGGGFMLARPPETVRIIEIVQAVEPFQRITSCPLGLVAHGKRLCPLHKRVDAALASMEEAFSTSTLAEVLTEPTSSVPLCEFPRTPARGRRRRSPRPT